MTEYLGNYPGLEYLALVPQDLRAQVANSCGMSPTVARLREVMLKYGRLSVEASKVVVVEPYFVKYQTEASVQWETYWYALLLEREEDSDGFRNELSRKLGFPGLSSIQGDSCQDDEIFGDDGYLHGDLDSFSSFAAVPVLDFDFGIADEDIADLFQDLQHELANVDPNKSGFGVGQQCQRSDYGGAGLAFADLIMDKYHIWKDVGCEPTGRVLNRSGACYQKLFRGDVLDVITLALGLFPKAKLVAAVYYAGLVYGFSNRTGVTVVDKGQSQRHDKVLHLEAGSSSCSQVFSCLNTFDCVVGADTGQVLQHLDRNVGGFSPFWKRVYGYTDHDKLTLITLLQGQSCGLSDVVLSTKPDFILAKPGHFYSSGWQTFEAPRYKADYLAWIPAGYRLALTGADVLSVRGGIIVMVSGSVPLRFERKSSASSQQIDAILGNSVWSSDLGKILGAKQELKIYSSFSKLALLQFRAGIDAPMAFRDELTTEVLGVSAVFHQISQSYDKCEQTTKQLQRIELSEPYESRKSFASYRLMGSGEDVHVTSFTSFDVKVVTKSYTASSPGVGVLLMGVITMRDHEVCIALDFHPGIQIYASSSTAFSFNITHIDDEETFDYEHGDPFFGDSDG